MEGTLDRSMLASTILLYGEEGENTLMKVLTVCF